MEVFKLIRKHNYRDEQEVSHVTAVPVGRELTWR